MNRIHRVSCIVAAHNEEKRIGDVLRAISGHPLIAETIVVDDGSSDNTKDVVRSFGNVKLVIHEKNAGKSMAVFSGLNQATHNIICLLDADLVGLTAQNITDLLQPVLSGRANVSISMRKNSPWIDRMLGIDYISGERVFARGLIADRLNEIPKLRQFGLEVFLNRIFIHKKCHIKVVFWKNVISPPKHKKDGLFAGIVGNILMLRDIFGTVSVFEVIRQFIDMRRLMVD